MAASLRISLNNMENGDISSGVLSSKERDLKRQMEKLHRCYMKKKEWKDSMRVVQQSMSREKKMLMETDKEPGSLRSCLDRLQSCIKVVSQQTLLERLETTSRLVDLSFTPPTGTENSAIISSEMFRIEIIFDPGGLVKDVRISHQGEPTSCDEITEVLRQGNFDEFIVHLKGLQSIYNISGDRKQKSKAYLALQALETDLNSLAQLQSSIKGVSNCIHKSPLGILLPRKGGCPMKLVYFVSPYDLLNKRTRSPHPMTVEAITEHGLGQSVTVCIEPHSHRRLQTIPLMSVVPQDGKSLPSFQALSQVNSTSLPACFTLMLARPIPVAMSVIHAIQEVTDIDVITEGKPESLLKLILAQSSGGKLSPGSEFFVTLPDQQHAYYLRDIGESSLDQTAKMVSRIPFTHPTNVANILNLLRQQLLFNTVISSCIRPYAKQDLMSSVVFELVCTSLQQFTIMFEHPLQDTMVTAEVDLSDITGVKFKVSIGEDGEDLLSDDAASKIFQRCWSVPVTLRSIIHKVSEQLRKEPSPEPVAMEIEQPPFVMPQEVTFATPYLPAMDSKSISSPGNMVLPNAKIPQGYGGIPPNTTQGAMLPPPIVEDSKKLDDDVPSSNPLLVTLLDQDSPDPDPPSVPESPMLSRLLEDSPSNNNTNSSLNNNNNVANLASSVPAPLKPGRGRPPKRKSVTDPPKGKSPKHRLTDNEYQSQSLSFESLTSSFDSDFQNASMDSQRFPHFSLSSPIDLTDDSVNPLRGLENTLDSIQSKQSMHHSSDPLANLTSELDSIQDVSIFSQTNSVPKNMARSTSLEGILNRSGEVSRTKDLHKPHHLQDSVPTNQARKTLVRQNSVGKVAQYQHQISIDSNDSFKAGSNLSFSRSTSFTHGNTSDSDTSLYSTRSFDLSDSFNNLSPVSNSSISRHDIGGDLTTEFKPELKLGHKDLRSLLMSSPNENSLLQSEKLKIKNAKGKMRMKLSGIKNSDLLGINRKKSSAEAYDFNSDEEDSNDLSMITASPTGLQLFNKSKTAKHLLNKIGKGDKLKKKEAKSTEPGKRKRDKKEKEHKKKKRLDSNSRATSCEMYSATPVESEDKTSTKLKIIKSVGVSMENSPRSSPSGREKGDGTRKSSINSQKSLKNSHKSLSMTSVNVSKEDSKLMTKTPKIKLKPIAIPPSSAVSNAKTPTPTSSPGSATPTSTTIGRIGAVSILTSGNSKAGGTTPSPGKVSTPTSAKTQPTFGGSKSFPSNKSVASSSTSLKAASAERKLSQSGRLSSGISKSSNGKYSSDRKSGSPSVSGSKSGLNSSKSLNSSSKGQSSNSFSKNSNNPLNSVLSFLNPKDKGLSSLPRIPKISSASSSNNNTKPTVSVTSTSVSTTTSVSTSIAGMSKLTTVNSHSNTKVSVSNNPHQGGVRNSPNTPGTPKNFPANSKNSANLNSKSTLVNSPNVRGSQMGSRSPSVNAANNKSPSSSNGKSPLSHTSNKLGINGRPPSNSNPPKTPVGSNTAHPLKTPTPGSGHNNGSPNINKPIPISTPPPTTTINKSNPQTSSPSSYPPKATPTGDQSPSVSNLSRNSPLLSQGPPGKTPNLVSKVSESPKSISVTTASKVTSPIMVSTDTPPKTTTPGSMVSPTTSCPSSNAKMRPRKSSLSAVIDKLTNAKVPSIRGQAEREKSSARLRVRDRPEPPQEVEISSCGPKRVELIWRDGWDGGEPIKEYLIQYNTSDNAFYWNSADEEVEYLDMSSKTAFISLSPWGWYSFRVLAKNSLGYSDPSKPTKKECNTPPERPTSNPVNVRTKTDKEGKLIITWDPMPRMQHNAPSFEYVVRWRKHGSTFWSEKIIRGPNANQHEVDVDDVYGLYDVQVMAKNSLGNSFQPVFTFRGHSGEGDPLIKPHDFRVDPTRGNRPHEAHFIWESIDPLDEMIRGKFRGYKLQYWKSSEGRRNKIEVPIVIDSDTANLRHDIRASIFDLPANTAFRAQVSVMNGHRAGPPSETIDFKTSEGVPGPVRNLQSDEVDSHHAVLKWDPPDEPNGLLQGYDLGYQKVNGETQGEIRALEPKINNPSHTSARITDLQPNNEYRFFVWARTSSGLGKKQSVKVLTKGYANSQMASIHQLGINLASHDIGIKFRVLVILGMVWTLMNLIFH